MRRQHGFSLLEMVIAITLVVLLYVTMLEKLLPLRGDAEAAAVATTVGTIRSALGLEVAARLVDGDLASIEGLKDRNPMTLLAEIPDNYLGEVAGVDPANLPSGHWYYDSAAHQLVYLVRHRDYFRTELPGVPRMVFRIEVVYNERGEIAGIRLDRVNAFIWTRSPEIAELLGQMP